MTQTKNSPPAENPWDSYFLNGESVSDDFMSEDERLDDLELRQVIQKRLKAIKTLVSLEFDIDWYLSQKSPIF